MLLFPPFSSFHVVGKETQSPLLILQQGKSKHTNINKAGNQSSPQSVPPGPHRATTAEGLSRRLRSCRAPKPSLVAALLPSLPSQSELGAWGSQGDLSLHSPFLMPGFVPGSRIYPWLALQIHTVVGTRGYLQGVCLHHDRFWWTKETRRGAGGETDPPAALTRQVCTRIRPPSSQLEAFPCGKTFLKFSPTRYSSTLPLCSYPATSKKEQSQEKSPSHP